MVFKLKMDKIDKNWLGHDNGMEWNGMNSTYIIETKSQRSDITQSVVLTRKTECAIQSLIFHLLEKR